MSVEPDPDDCRYHEHMGDWCPVCGRHLTPDEIEIYEEDERLADELFDDETE